MSGGQPDLCIDIFSQMANLLANFNNNMRAGDSEVFSHEGGFVNSQPANNVSTTGGANFEQ